MKYLKVFESFGSELFKEISFEEHFNKVNILTPISINEVDYTEIKKIINTINSKLLIYKSLALISDITASNKDCEEEIQTILIQSKNTSNSPRTIIEIIKLEDNWFLIYDYISILNDTKISICDEMEGVNEYINQMETIGGF